jgi:vacuolar protein sorting-associated protein IST1
VSTLVWAANRADVAELHEVKKQLAKKYGKEWVERAEQDADHVVNERVVHKLGIRPPSAALVQKYLLEIAKTHNIQWTPTEKPLTDEQMAWQSMPAPTGATVPMAPGSAFSHLFTNTNPGGSGVPNPLPQQPPSGGGAGNGGGGGNIRAAPTMPVATPISPAHGFPSSKKGFEPLDNTPTPSPSAPAQEGEGEEEEAVSASAVYDIPLPPSEPPVLPLPPPPPPPELPPAPATTGSGDHLGVSGSAGGNGSGLDVEDLESRFNRLKGR